MFDVIRRRKASLAAVVATGAMSVGVAASPAAAQPVVSGGLVNITITDVLSHNQVSVQVPIGVAANVCGVQANLLAQNSIQQPVSCTSATQQSLPVAFR